MENQLAPLVIFTYKRSDTLRTLIESLLKCSLVSETSLFIFSDGPKGQKDVEEVEQVRSFIKEIKGFKNITTYFSEVNKGLATSIITGVSNVLKSHDTVIVLEDDLIVTANFLAFMNKALAAYVAYDRVFSVSGYSFDLKAPKKNTADAYFLNRGWSWGWATWKNRWDNVDWTVSDFEEFSKDLQLQKEFNKGGSDLTAMLQKQMTNKLDSWAIRWFYHQFRTKGLTLYPTNSKIINNGFDARATHTTGSSSRYIPKVDVTLKESFNFPQAVEITADFQRAFQRKMGIISRIKSKASSIVISLFRSLK
jgi:glycosyltransferase involved in cell wall biosynthesis